MANETPDKPQSAPQKAEPQEAEVSPSKDAETVTLVATNLPFYVLDLRLPQEDGSTLVFGRDGTEVPAEDADKHIEAATLAGVALERKA